MILGIPILKQFRVLMFFAAETKDAGLIPFSSCEGFLLEYVSVFSCGATLSAR